MSQTLRVQQEVNKLLFSVFFFSDCLHNERRKSQVYLKKLRK